MIAIACGTLGIFSAVIGIFWMNAPASSRPHYNVRLTSDGRRVIYRNGVVFATQSRRVSQAQVDADAAANV